MSRFVSQRVVSGGQTAARHPISWYWSHLLLLRCGSTATSSLSYGNAVPASALRSICTPSSISVSSIVSRNPSFTSRSFAQAATARRSTNNEDLALRYQKMSQREHILLRPESYVGSIQSENRMMWIYDEASKRMICKECQYIPAFLRIFDEILVNAADNSQRNTKTIRMTRMDVNISHTITAKHSKLMKLLDIPKEFHNLSIISIGNDGVSVPIVIHPTENIYVPELIFGHLLTSSNYDDSVQRFTGGRHGFGAKLTNIFSKWFCVEVWDPMQKLYYRQTWSNNMSETGKRVMIPFSELDATKFPFPSKNTDNQKIPYTKISFIPDFTAFGASALTEDHSHLMMRRVVDTAALLSSENITVSLNGKRVACKSFSEYISRFHDPKNVEKDPDESDDEPNASNLGKFVETKLSDHFHVAVGPVIPAQDVIASQSSVSSIRNLSFVNGVYTVDSGTHVTFIADRIARRIMEHISKAYKHIPNLHISTVRSQFSLFVNCLIPNPTFDSQSKNSLTTPASAFSNELHFTPSFFDAVIKKTGVVERILSIYSVRTEQELARKTKRLPKNKLKASIPKLEDANFAGTPRSSECTLILTEGDSAKALVLSGMSVLGRDRYGVFPLRGKLLNVRDVSKEVLLKNEELQSIVAILGLKWGQTYDTQADRASLRYGKVMLMTDQDTDGSHIKGLFINFIDTFWPSLIECNSFVEEFTTSIVKARRGGQILSFASLPEFFSWKDQLSANEFSKWSIKYYKGLGTNTAEEGKEYFRNISNHRKALIYQNSSDRAAIRLAFDKHLSDERKNWLKSYDPNNFLSTNLKKLTYAEFINKELIIFSYADNVRSLPHVIDGLKPVQRKIIYACLKKNLRSELKVAQLAGYISEVTNYHHGEASLFVSIIGMAQDFVGSNNNLPLLTAGGQFGTRHLGGSDAASARYIFTQLTDFAFALFHPDDMPLLNFQNEEGQVIEPSFFIPILPLVLLNGPSGIGTGFSTSIPTFSPLDIIRNLKERLLNDTPFQPMHPYAIGFTGNIIEETKATIDSTVKVSNDDSLHSRSWTVAGKINITEGNVVEITELPLSKWTQPYKEFLNSLLDLSSNPPNGRDSTPASNDAEELPSAMKVPSFSILRYSEYHSNDSVRFVIELKPSELNKIRACLPAAFKLHSKLYERNMHCFNESSQIQKYPNANTILNEFYTVRLQYYERRRDHLLNQFRFAVKKSEMKIKFLEEVVTGALHVFRRPRQEIVKEMNDKQFLTTAQLSAMENALKTNTSSAEANTKHPSQILPSKSNSDSLPVDSFDYLLSMPLTQFTSERISDLKESHNKLLHDQKILQTKTAKHLWLEDLSVIEQLCRSYITKKNGKETAHTVSPRKSQRKQSTSASKR